MNLRSLQHSDMFKLEVMHKKYYPNDAMPDWGKLQSILVAEAENGEIISAGGVELIAEGVLLTNYDIPAIARGKALLQHMINMKMTCSRLDQDYLHVFENGHDEVWIKALEAYDFKPAGNAFFKKVS